MVRSRVRTVRDEMGRCVPAQADLAFQSRPRLKCAGGSRIHDLSRMQRPNICATISAGMWGNAMQNCRIPALGLFACLTFSGCSSVPDFQSVGFGYKDGYKETAANLVTPADIAQHIQCELHEIYESPPFPNNQAKQNWQSALDNYLITAALSLQVSDNAGFSPSLTFIAPYSTPMTNFSFGINGQVGSTRQRIFTETISFAYSDLRKLAPADWASHCGDREPKDGFHINGIDFLGNLGLGEIASMGLAAQNVAEIVFPQSTAPTGYTLDASLPAFASTIQFTLTKGAGIGPTWTLTTFKGPTGSGGGGGGGAGGGSGAGGGAGGGGGGAGGAPSGLLNYGRTDNHNVIVTFTPIQAPKGGRGLYVFTPTDARAAAAARAQDMILDLRLQQLQGLL